jgi:hypothetical protein
LNKRHFCLFKIVVSVFHCDISKYICIKTRIASYLYFSLFYLSPFLMVISTGLKILYRTVIFIIFIPAICYVVMVSVYFLCISEIIYFSLKARHSRLFLIFKILLFHLFYKQK